jgi:hypothetical protein
VKDARAKFPNSVNCSTIHGLAFKAMHRKYRSNGEKMTGRINAIQLAELLKIKKTWRIDKNHALPPRSQGYLILDTLRRFTQSADAEPKAEHVPRHGSLLAAPESTIAAVNDFTLRGAKHVWGWMQNADDPVPLGHDGYLKLWALSEPAIGAGFILLDEAHDTNPALLGVLRKQSAQIICVGDRYQQLYEWRGAVNAMERFPADNTTYLTLSFRFGETIAEAATRILSLLDEKTPLRGNPNVNSRIGPVEPQTILARTNASTITAIIQALELDQRPHLVGGTGELMEILRGVQSLRDGEPSPVPEFFGFENWEQVVEFARSDEGEHLLMFVNLVESRGERQLMWALNRTVDEQRCDITMSTVHKAKGREWSTVRLLDDFVKSHSKRGRACAEDEEANGYDPAELRLLYVAMTRAKEAIEIPESLLLLTAPTSQAERTQGSAPGAARAKREAVR